MLELSPDIPPPFADLAVLAARLDASLVIFDGGDNVRFASQAMRRLYGFCDFTAPLNFDTLLIRAWAHGVVAGEVRPADREQHMAFAKERRLRERLEFTRRYPTKLICSHVRIPNGWTAQLRVEPDRVGLEHYFCSDVPVTGLVEAIRRKEEAEQRAAALDCLAVGVAVTTPDGRILHANAALLDLIDRGDGFEGDDRGRLRAVDPADDAALARLIALAATGALASRRAVLHVQSRRSGEVHTVSITQGADQAGAAAIVAVSTPRFDDVAVAHILRQSFGLTAAEAALAAQIGNGRSNDEAVKELGKSPATGREQLAAIFRKLRNQNIAVGGQLGLSRWVGMIAAITGAARTRGHNRRG